MKPDFEMPEDKFYLHDAMLAWVLAAIMCPFIYPSVSLSHASVVSKWLKSSNVVHR